MKTATTILKKIGFTALCLIFFNGTVNATVYTALLSGNFNSALTWGGIVPGSLLISDIVIIPVGITVTLNNDQAFSGASSLIVDGTLTSGSSHTTLSLTGGSLTGTGGIQVDSLVLNTVSGIGFTGSVIAENVTSLGAGITSAANVTVNSTLTLAAGTLNFAAGSLTMAAGTTITMAGGMLTNTGSGVINLANPYNVIYTAASTLSGIELTGTGLHNVVVDITGNITMSADAVINGLLTLTSGTLQLNGHSLTLNPGADLSALGTGNIASTIASNLVIATTGSLTGLLQFAAGSNIINNLTINLSNISNTVALGSNVIVNGALNLLSGRVLLGANNLLMNAGAIVTGGGSGSYVVTNGAGEMVMNLVAGATDRFDVGTVLNYAPIVISAISGSASGNVGVNLINQVYGNGYTGTVISATDAMVSATWFVTTTATGAFNYTMNAMWDASMEVNGFDRTQAYLSHYTSGAWDVSPSLAAVSAGGSLYSMTRTGITSLSPFHVSGTTTTNVASDISVNNRIILSPNPTTGILNFITSEEVKNIEIYTTIGTVVKRSEISNNSVSVTELPAGLYFVRFMDKNINTVQRFVKQ